MIRFRDTILEEYFIDPETAIITNSKGEIQKTTIRKNGYMFFKKMDVHKIQAHTNYGYKKYLVIHHLDNNKMNNSLSNLVYITQAEHNIIHKKGKNLSSDVKTKISKTLTGRRHSEEWKKKLSEAHIGTNNYMYGKKYKWINNGIENRYIPFDEEIPDGFRRGRIIRNVGVI